MFSFNSQIHWRGLGTIVVIELLALLVLAFAVVTYVEWSSNSAVAEFTNATESSASKSSASDPNPSSGYSDRIQRHDGQAGCPKGKKPLPTQLMPLP
jgi:nitrate/TMAO reductase-like tetraheme cytochrome c subunit